MNYDCKYMRTGKRPETSLLHLNRSTKGNKCNEGSLATCKVEIIKIMMRHHDIAR